MPLEVELKLAVLVPTHESQLVSRVAACPLLRGIKPQRAALLSTYYDTPQHSLQRHRVALRVRQVQDRLVFTVKSAAASVTGLSQRAEWETPFTGTFAFEAISDLHLRQWLSREKITAHLRPIFTTRFTRHTWTLRHGQHGAIEIALDVGDIVAALPEGESASAWPQPPAHAAIAELELEVLSGGQATLRHALRLARSLAKQLPLLPANRSKAERGYALVSAINQSAQHQPSDSVRQRPKAEVSPISQAPTCKTAAMQAFRHIALDGLEHLLQYLRLLLSLAAQPELRQPTAAQQVALTPSPTSLPCTSDATDAEQTSHSNASSEAADATEATWLEAVHQFRVQCRRLRSAMRFFAPLLPPVFQTQVVTQLHELAAWFGPTRGLDVLLAEVVSPVAQCLPHDKRLQALSLWLQQQQHLARQALLEHLHGKRPGEFALLLSSLLHEPGFAVTATTTTATSASATQAATASTASATSTTPAAPPTLAEFAKTELPRLARKVRQRARQARLDQPQSLHRLRIAVKRMRYCLEFCAALYRPKDLARRLRRLTQAQEVLGQIHDLANAGTWLEPYAAQSPTSREAISLVAGWHLPHYRAWQHALPRLLRELEDFSAR